MRLFRPAGTGKAVAPLEAMGAVESFFHTILFFVVFRLSAVRDSVRPHRSLRVASAHLSTGFRFQLVRS